MTKLFKFVYIHCLFWYMNILHTIRRSFFFLLKDENTHKRKILGHKYHLRESLNRVNYDHLFHLSINFYHQILPCFSSIRYKLNLILNILGIQPFQHKVWLSTTLLNSTSSCIESPSIFSQFPLLFLSCHCSFYWKLLLG